MHHSSDRSELSTINLLTFGWVLWKLRAAFSAARFTAPSGKLCSNWAAKVPMPPQIIDGGGDATVIKLVLLFEALLKACWTTLFAKWTISLLGNDLRLEAPPLPGDDRW